MTNYLFIAVIVLLIIATAALAGLMHYRNKLRREESLTGALKDRMSKIAEELENERQAVADFGEEYNSLKARFELFQDRTGRVRKYTFPMEKGAKIKDMVGVLGTTDAWKHIRTDRKSNEATIWVVAQPKQK